MRDMLNAGLRALHRGMLVAAVAGAAPVAGEVLRVGSAEEIDTSEIRRVIEETRGDRLPPPSVAGPRLGLEDAVKIALEHNLSLQIAALDRDAVEHEVPATKAFFHPTPGYTFVAADSWVANGFDIPDPDEDEPLGFDPGRDDNDSQLGRAFLRQELPTGGTVTVATDLLRQSGDDFAGNDVYEGGAQIELRQPLMRGGRIYVATRQIQDAEFNLGIFEAQLRAQILQVIALTTEAYYNTILAERLIQVSEQAIERDLELIEASEALFRAGRSSQRDVLSAEIRLSDDQADLARRRAALGRAQLALRDVLGLPIGESVAPADATVPFRPVEVRLGAWIETALSNRPEIQAVLYRLEQSALAVRVAGNAVLPRLDAVGLFRRNDFSTSYRKVWGFDSQSWVAGFEFEIPFGNVAARERLRSARLVHARIERELANTRRLIELEVRDEEISLRENLEDLEAQTAKVEQARSKLEVARVRFSRGLANNLDVTDAQEDLVNAESDLLAAIVDYTNGLARLEARIAGPL